MKSIEYDETKRNQKRAFIQFFFLLKYILLYFCFCKNKTKEIELPLVLNISFNFSQYNFLSYTHTYKIYIHIFSFRMSFLNSIYIKEKIKRKIYKKQIRNKRIQIQKKERKHYQKL